MNMILMNKTVPVANLKMDTDSGLILSIGKMQNPEYLPVLTIYYKDKAAGLRKWLSTRSIPKTRKNLPILLEQAGVETADALSLKSLGLNLSDQYWFKPENSNIKWSEVNLFENDFLPQRFSATNEINTASSYSPDVSSNGELSKFWLIKNGERYLYKESTAPYYQQNYNEVFASKLLAKMDIQHVDYDFDKIGKITYSICKTFITPDTEYVPALYIKDVLPKTNNENNYMHFVRCMNELKIPCNQKQLDVMLTFDYLINNADRHFGNFGFIRDVNTLQFKGIAPLFDQGNSLWYQSQKMDMILSEQEAKPFAMTHERQLKMLTKFNLPIEKLSKNFIESTIDKIYSFNCHMEAERLEKLKYNVYSLANRIKHLQKQQSNSKSNSR